MKTRHLSTLFLLLAFIMPAYAQKATPVRLSTGPGPYRESHSLFYKAYSYQLLGNCEKAQALYADFINAYRDERKEKWHEAARFNANLCAKSGSEPSFAGVSGQKSSVRVAKRRINKPAARAYVPAVKLKDMNLAKAFLIQFVALGNANTEHNALSAYGKTRVEKISGKELYRYFKGPFQTRTEAVKVLMLVKAAGFPGAFIVPLKNKPLLIREIKNESR